MTHDPDHDFKSALRSLATRDLPPAPEPHTLAATLLRRDKRRTRLLATCSLLFWTCGTAGILLLLVGLNRFIIFIRIAPNLPWSLPPKPSSLPPTTPISEVSTDMMFWGTNLLHHSMPYIAASVIALMLAAVLTTLLIFSARQSALNRINLSLAQIAAQLKQSRNP